MANNFSIEQAREKLARKTGISGSEFTYSGLSREDNFIRYKFYKGTDRGIIYTVLSDEEVEDLEQKCPTDFAP